MVKGLSPPLPGRHGPLLALVSRHLDGDTDLAHDSEHIARVYRWAVYLAGEEGEDPDLAGAAALVHDLVNIPKESADRPLGSERSAAASRGVLPRAGYAPAEVDAIVEAVRTCSWSRGQRPTSGLGAILQDADRMDAIGAIGIARNVACAQAMATRGSGGRLYDPDDPLGESDRTLDDRRNTLDHYAVKLLRLADAMNTDAARAEATRRHDFMRRFLDQLASELRPPR